MIDNNIPPPAWLQDWLTQRGATSLLPTQSQPPQIAVDAVGLFKALAPAQTQMFPDMSGGGMPDEFGNPPLSSTTSLASSNAKTAPPLSSYSITRGPFNINNPAVQGNLLGKGLGLATGLSMLGPLGGLFGGAIGAYQDTELGNQAFAEATGHVGTQSFWSNFFNNLTFGIFGSDADEQLQEDYTSIIGFDNPYGLNDAQEVEGIQDQPFTMNDLEQMQIENKIANILATWPTDLPSIGGPTSSPSSSVTGVGFGPSVGDSLATGEGFGQPTDDTSGDAPDGSDEPDADDPF